MRLPLHSPARTRPPGRRARTLSNRADLVSDGDALVEVQVPKTVPMDKVALTLNGIDVGKFFVADEAARTFVAGPGGQPLPPAPVSMAKTR